MPKNLSAQQERFALNIAKGMNQTDAYRAAGYKSRGSSAEVNASKTIRIAKVADRIRGLAAETKDESIADARERQQFWTATLRDSELEMKDRLKASELLGKAHADFIERSEINIKGPIEINLLDLPTPT